MSDVDAPVAALSIWRASPPVLVRLLIGLIIFGAGEGCIIAAGLGNSPWTVFAEGIAENTAIAIGTATIVVSAGVLLLWLPLRQRPGLGTLANGIVIGLAIDASLRVLPSEPPAVASWLLMPAGIALVALGSGFYLTAALGPGPRDGLMTGLNRRFGISLRLARAGVEISVLIAGIVLGGTAGIGTLAFALGIGPGVQLVVGRLSTERWRALQARSPAPDPASRFEV